MVAAAAALAAGNAVILALAFALPVMAAGSGLEPWPPVGVSPNGQHIHDFYMWISVPALIVFFGVEGALLFVILKYRRSKLPAGYVPPQTHGNNMLEVVWTLIPLVVILTIGVFSFFELQRDFQAQTLSPDIEIHVVAHQFGWTYEYPDGFSVSQEGLNAADNPMVVPVGKVVRLKIDTKDVIHSWWVPDITGKTDAVPGYSNYTWMKIDQPGKFRGECAELCGAGHYTMQISVQAVSQSDYDAWVAKQKAAAHPSPSPSAPASPSPSASPSAGASPSPSGSPAPSPSPTR
jgi:cytochrome c oxidase subunit II